MYIKRFENVIDKIGSNEAHQCYRYFHTRTKPATHPGFGIDISSGTGDYWVLSYIYNLHASAPFCRFVIPLHSFKSISGSLCKGEHDVSTQKRIHVLWGELPETRSILRPVCVVTYAFVVFSLCRKIVC